MHQSTPHRHYRRPHVARRTSESTSQRPSVDVYALGFLALVITVFGLWLPLVGSVFMALFFGAMGLSSGAFTLLFLIAALALLTAIGEIAFGVGSWRLRPWAWTVGVVSQGLYLLTYLLMYLVLITQFGPFVGGGELIYAILAALILLYLLTARVRRLFGHEGFPIWVSVARIIAVAAVLCGIGAAVFLIMGSVRI